MVSSSLVSLVSLGDKVCLYENRTTYTPRTTPGPSFLREAVTSDINGGALHNDQMDKGTFPEPIFVGRNLSESSKTRQIRPT